MNQAPAKPSLRLWKTLVTLFVIGWVICVTAFDWWPLVVEHWGIAAVMIGGSLVAGSTPMGGANRRRTHAISDSPSRRSA